jgi:probable F420-dependent oxidoreductase
MTAAASIGRLGVWSGSRQWSSDPAGTAEAAAELEELGYGALWLGGARGDLALPEAVLDATQRLVVATGIVNIWRDRASDTIASHRRLTAAHPGRFLLGVGMGHAQQLDPYTGPRYERPFSHLVEYLDELDAAAPPVPVEERVLAALGPRTLRLAAVRSAGAHPYLVTPEYTAEARTVLGDGPLLAVEQKAVIETDADAARSVARHRLAPYLELPNYLANLRRIGFDDADFAAGGSDRLVDALVAWGDVDAVRARIDEHLAAGADHVAIQLLEAADPLARPRASWRALAAGTPSR